jgi:hypothetical protein
MSSYLRQLLDEYEKNCTLIFEVEETCLLHAKISGLVASTKSSDFKVNFCDRYSEVVELINKDVLRPVVSGG